MTQDEELLSTQEAAKYLGISRQSMHSIAVRNGIGRQIGRAFVFTKGELDAWVNKPRPQGGRPPKSYTRAPSPVALV